METISSESRAISIDDEIFVVDPAKQLKPKSLIISKHSNQFILQPYCETITTEIIGACCYRIFKIE